MYVIKRTIQRIINWATQDGPAEVSLYTSPGKKVYNPVRKNSGIEVEDGLNFTIHRANGGVVVQVRTYDSNNDRFISDLYIITEDEDLGQELGLIVTRNILAR